MTYTVFTLVRYTSKHIFAYTLILLFVVLLVYFYPVSIFLLFAHDLRAGLLFRNFLSILSWKMYFDNYNLVFFYFVVIFYLLLVWLDNKFNSIQNAPFHV